MADLTDLMRREAGMGDGARSHPRAATVSSYNEDTHAVKVMLQPEDKETGWMPLGSLAIGKGFGIAMGANEGDQVVVCFLDGDPNSGVILGRLYSDEQKPPKVKAGEMTIFHESKTALTIDKDGALTIGHKSGGSLVWDKDGKVTIDNGDRGIKLAGDVQINA